MSYKMFSNSMQRLTWVSASFTWLFLLKAESISVAFKWTSVSITQPAARRRRPLQSRKTSTETPLLWSAATWTLAEFEANTPATKNEAVCPDGRHSQSLILNVLCGDAGLTQAGFFFMTVESTVRRHFCDLANVYVVFLLDQNILF